VTVVICRLGVKKRSHANGMDSGQVPGIRQRFFNMNFINRRAGGFQRIAGILALGLLMVSAAGDRAAAGSGPLQSTNRLPLHLLFLKPRPVPVHGPARGDLEVGVAAEYSNTYFDYRNNHWDVLMDMEMMVVELSLVYSPASRTALRLDLPFVSMGSGFLDGFLENFHDALGVSNYGREKRPKNEYAYRVAKDGLSWVQGEQGTLEIADTVVSGQYELFKNSGALNISGSLLMSLKLPTGDPDRGLGSGAFDFGLFIPMRWSAEPWSFFLMPGAAFIGDPQTRGADVSARNTVTLFGGVAYEYSPRTTWLVQLNYYTSPIEQTGLEDLDDGSLELDIGFQRALAEYCVMEFVFGEDLTRALPDFNLRLGLRWTWRSA
jgi:hypothetical protein